MKNFILIMFFAKTVLLTQYPIDIHEPIVLSPNEPVKAITTGASIQIDVSSMIEYSKGTDIKAFREKLSAMFPKNSIRGKLTTKKGEEVRMTYNGGHLFNDKEVLLSLSANDSSMLLDKEFSKIELESDEKLTSVKVFWKNHKK